MLQIGGFSLFLFRKFANVSKKENGGIFPYKKEAFHCCFSSEKNRDIYFEKIEQIREKKGHFRVWNAIRKG